MKNKYIIIVLFFISCHQKISKNQPKVDENTILNSQQINKIMIDNSPTRGTGYTDSVGSKKGLVFITTTIINKYSVQKKIQISLSNEYKYPIEYGSEKFKIILLPNEWTQVGRIISDSMMNKLLKEGNYHLVKNRTIEPKEKYVITIGLSRPIKQDLCSAAPFGMVIYNENELSNPCIWDLEENQKQHEQNLKLGSKVGFCTTGEVYENCKVIQIGEITNINTD